MALEGTTDVDEERHHDKSGDNREQPLRRDRWVEVASRAYNLAAVAVPPTAGFVSGGSALISCGMGRSS